MTFSAINMKNLSTSLQALLILVALSMPQALSCTGADLPPKMRSFTY